MPEMPEVEIIRQHLDSKLAGKKIKSLDILLPRQLKWPESPEALSRLCCGLAIEGVERKGKYLLMRLEGEIRILFHLRMTGSLVYVEAGQEYENAHLRAVFYLDDGSRLCFADIRTFGVIYGLKPGELEMVKGLREMGPEPLSKEFTAEYLEDITRRVKAPIKNLLLDQRKIGGIGNIYADEALFLAHVHPRRQAGSLSHEECRSLWASVNQVIEAGIRDGGTTFRDYRNGAGGKGNHQDHLYVYHRQGEPCRQCGVLIEYAKVGGRGTHYCPLCQRMEP